MAIYQGAIFIWTWNGGSIDGLTVEKNAIYWSPFENAPALLNKGDIKAGTATFRNNTIFSTAPRMVESNTAISLTSNAYQYFGPGTPDWKYGGNSFTSLRSLQDGPKQESRGRFQQPPLRAWAQIFVQREWWTQPGRSHARCPLR